MFNILPPTFNILYIILKYTLHGLNLRQGKEKGLFEIHTQLKH